MVVNDFANFTTVEESFARAWSNMVAQGLTMLVICGPNTSNYTIHFSSFIYPSITVNILSMVSKSMVSKSELYN
jgi:hypothetical protein